ncbi:MAG: DUF302 domain-containing protein [Candidatus Thiodiazotropha lotti]|nr:DUF302 domain-containing protein [Candidatus Thiodiazotropha lotti]MCG7989699.1 DUF302 domain-containing protein [Candidatus Thiodiazotropha lotti]MCG8003039.1 DUF302 domain-containing protein [Candidatus Thiodiazotropha lotti]MCG8008667.1 DUF302 domain-containing protein [Candidatus Thiodiazotropha lotti]MCG8010899.1 DUF302 domain-containing protein [Candidatus Thiodiazotropha lotti]
MKTLTILLVSLFFTSGLARADGGLVTLPSQFSFEETVNRFVAAVEGAGLKVFSKIDHSAGAEKVGQSLRPTLLIIFGSPKVGTALMTSDQRAGIDLPMKALVWEDDQAKVWLGYNHPDKLFDRFAINDREKVRRKVTGALQKFAKKATQP